MAQFSFTRAQNPGWRRWEKAVTLDGDHEGVHTCIKFHQAIYHRFMYLSVCKSYLF